MVDTNQVVIINTGKFGPEGAGFSSGEDLMSGGIRLSPLREETIDTKSLLPGISVRLVDRQSLQAGIAAKKALGPDAADREPERGGVVLGSSFGATASMYDFFHKITAGGVDAISPMEFPNTVSNAAASRVGIWFALKGHCVSISNGNLSGLDAVGYAFREIGAELTDYCLAGGSEEIPEVVRKIYAKVTEDGRSEEVKHGIAREILYEGAAMLLLASAEWARHKKLKPVAAIAGYQSGMIWERDGAKVIAELEGLLEHCGYQAPEVCFGAGAVPGGGFSYAVIEAAKERFGAERVFVHNRFGDTVVNYFALEGIWGINAMLDKLAADPERRSALVFNVENDGRFSAMAIHKI